MRTISNVLLALAMTSCTASLWLAHQQSLSVLGATETSRITGHDTPPPCNTYMNTMQCNGDAAVVYCIQAAPGPGLPRCQGDCTGYFCDGTNTVAYCSSHWAPSLNAYDCTYKAATCGHQEVAPAGATCVPRFFDQGPGNPPLLACSCGDLVTIANACPDQTVDDPGVCAGQVIISYYEPPRPDSHWLAGVRIRLERQRAAMLN